MADLPSLRIGDTLKVPYIIESLIQDPTFYRPVRVNGGLWISRELVEAAEHIPAPRVFKRGDWVRHAKDTPSRYGLVTKVRSGTAALGGLITVSWPEGPAYDYYADDLEPDEAPE